MKAQNTAVSNAQFGRFLIFFVIVIVVLVASIFFGTQVPAKENVQLKAQMELQEEQIVFQNEFLKLNTGSAQLLDTLNMAGVNAELIDGRITAKIQQMDALVQQYNGADKAAYMTVVKGLTAHKDDKKVLRQGTGKEAQMADYEKRIAQLEKNRDEWKIQAEKLQMQLQMMNR